MSFSKEKIVAGVTVPAGWFVAQAGQDPLHCLWFVALVNGDDMFNRELDQPRSTLAEECDTLEEALRIAVSKIDA